MKRLFILFSCVLVLSCQTTGTLDNSNKNNDPGGTKPTVEQGNFIDSTLYFNDKTASVSLRAPMNERGQLGSGYQLQFRALNSVPLKNIVIITGGERIVLERGLVYVSANKGLNYSLSLSDSLYIAVNPRSTLLFEFDGQSKIIEMKDHKLTSFMAGGD